MPDPRSGSSGSPSPDPPSQYSDAARTGASSGPGDAPRPEYLEQVMRETLEGSSQFAAVTPAELAGLIELARRIGPVPWNDSLAEEIVNLVLKMRLSHLPAAPTDWPEMGPMISAALLEDPHARERLESLWQQLRNRVENP